MDFETGDLGGWEKSGNAFDHQPTLNDNPVARGRAEPSNHQGAHWIGTFERFQGRSGQNPGDIQGDEPQGTLTSPPFTLPAGTLSFLIGGGNHPETRVELLIVDHALAEQARAFYETGKNIETMERITWDLHPIAGRTGRIRIVDESSDEWGHINVDDFQLEGNVPAPEVVGHDLTDAKKILAGANLTLGQISKANSDVEPDTVLRQDPVAGTEVPVGTQVNVSVAQKEMIAVPDLRGQSRQEAENILKKERLRLGEVVKRFSDQPADSVVWQEPAAGTKVAVGTAVELWVAVNAPVELPDVRGREVKEAEEILAKLRLRVGQVTKRLSYQPEGTIVRQEPAPGNLALVGTAVDLWVAVRVAAKVPDVRGQGVEEAASILRKARLRPGQRFDHFSQEEPGTVLDQSPAAGTRVVPDSAVDLFVASKEMVDVPDVRGHNRWDAEETIRAARLSVGEVSEQPANLKEDIVVGQDPAPGANVGVGTDVHLSVMAGTVTAVPDVRGYNREQAGKILADARLRLADVLAVYCDQQAGTILDQSPSAGMRVSVDAPVTLWAAAEPETPAGKRPGILAGIIILLGGGFYLLFRFAPDYGISLGRAVRRVRVLLRRRRKRRSPAPPRATNTPDKPKL
ncbi:MAG: PASTA domain-containing protein [Planctomycetota bacterium]